MKKNISLLKRKNYRTSHKVRTKFFEKKIQMNIDKQLKLLDKKNKMKGGQTFKGLLDENRFSSIKNIIMNTELPRKESIESIKESIKDANPGTTTPLWVETIQEFVIELSKLTDVVPSNKIDIMRRILPNASLWINSYTEDLNLFSKAYYNLYKFSKKSQQDLSRGAISLLTRPINFITTESQNTERIPIIIPPKDLNNNVEIYKFVLKLPFEMLNANDWNNDAQPRAFAFTWFILAPSFQELINSIFSLLERKILFPMQTKYSEIIYQIPKEKLSGIPWTNNSQKIGLLPEQITEKLGQVKEEYARIRNKFIDDNNMKIIDWIQIYIKASEYVILNHALEQKIVQNLFQYKIMMQQKTNVGGNRIRHIKNKKRIQKGGDLLADIKNKIKEWKAAPYDSTWSLPENMNNSTKIGKEIIMFYLDEEQTALNQLESWKNVIKQKIPQNQQLS